MDHARSTGRRVPRTLARAVLLAALLALALATGLASAAQAQAPEEGPAELWYFWGEGCPYCELASAWLDDLRADHPGLVVHEVEVWDDREGQARFVAMLAERGQQATGVPAFVLGEEVWVGFSEPIAEDIAATVASRLAAAPEDAARDPAARTAIDLGPFGTVDAAARSMTAATVLIAFVDGFNPCSLWVLTVLLAMILPSRSRGRIAVVGGTFLLVTAAVYGVFIAGVVAAFAVVGHAGWIRVAVALLALAFAAVNVKDYFAYKQGLSFTIPDRFKPRIYRGGRTVSSDRPLPTTLALTVLFAAGVALVELPCTAGFPVVWTGLTSSAGVTGLSFAGLLGLYLLVYLVVEIALVTGALVTLRTTRLQEVHGRALKLVGGTVMGALAVVLLTDPSIMERLTGSLLVVGGALAAAGVVLAADRARSRAGTRP